MGCELDVINNVVTCGDMLLSFSLSITHEKYDNGLGGPAQQ